MGDTPNDALRDKCSAWVKINGRLPFNEDKLIEGLYRFAKTVELEAKIEALGRLLVWKQSLLSDLDVVEVDDIQESVNKLRSALAAVKGEDGQ